MSKAGRLSAPKACLFDLDGLLIDSEPLQAMAWKEATEQFHATLTTEQLRQLKGRRRDENARLVRALLDDSGTPQQLLTAREPISKRLVADAPAMPGAEQLIRFCNSRRLPMVLVTSSTQDSLVYKTAGHPWLQLIERRVTGDDPELRAGKPAPDPYLLAIQRLDVQAHDCWAFEDSLAGCESALKAGCWVWQLMDSACEPSNQEPNHLIHRKLTRISTLMEGENQLRNSF